MIEFVDYLEQKTNWPQSGRHIMAQYDEQSIWVYQAYRPEIAEFAVEHQQFGGPFSYSRMSWIKPNFLWMMYRSGWAQKEGQEHVLAIRLSRLFFEQILTAAVPSTYSSLTYAKTDDWKQALQNSDVRLQWDPDHDVYGNKQERRAIQLGLRGEFLARFGKTEALQIVDLTEEITKQYKFVSDRQLDLLQTPHETVYRPSSIEAQRNVGIN